MSHKQGYRVALRFVALAGVATAITAGLYVFGTQHVPNYSTGLFGRTGPDTLPLKSWLATGVLALASVQLGLAVLPTDVVNAADRRPVSK